MATSFFDRARGSFFDSGGSSFFDKNTLTPTQAQTRQVYQELLAEQDEEGKKIQPLRKLFEVLSTGQYVSANVVEEIIKDAQEKGGVQLGDYAKAIWDGFRGGLAGYKEGQGSYGDIFRDYTDFEEKKVFGEGRETKLMGEMDWADVLGFAGDVVLDPTTYFGLVPMKSATKGANMAAKSFADDSIKLAYRKFAKGLGAKGDELAKLAKSTFDPKEFDRLAEISWDKALQYFHKNAGDDLARNMTRIYKESYQKGLSEPAQKLREDISNEAQELLDFFDTDEFVQSVTEASARYSTVDTAQYLDTIKDPIERIVKKAQEEGYEGAGEAAWRIFGFEIAKQERGATALLSKWDGVKRYVGDTKVGSTFSDAWWTITNKGPLGEVKKLLGVRNPYQKYLRAKELEAGDEYLKNITNKEITKVAKVVGQFGDEAKQKYVRFIAAAEAAYKTDNSTNALDLLRRAWAGDQNALKTMESFGVSVDDFADLEEMANQIIPITHGWNRTERAWSSYGYVKDENQIVNYLPHHFVEPDKGLRRSQRVRPGSAVGSSSPSPTQKRSFTAQEHLSHETALLSHFLGVSDETARAMVERGGVSRFSRDLDEMLYARAYAHAKMSKRVHMIEQFREFGIPVAQVQDELGEALNKSRASIDMMGMKAVADSAFDGYLFDADVADILDRATKMTDPDGYNIFKRMFAGFTGWWKGIVTMTTGFHARNYFSNQVSGTLKHGAKWWNPQDQMAALAGAIYSLRKTDPKKMLQEAGMDEGLYKRLLNRRYGNFTLRELADEARRRGVISEAQMGFSAKDMAQKFSEKSNLNIFSNRFVGRDLSYQAGSIVESSSRFQSFLIDYRDLAKTPSPDVLARLGGETAEHTTRLFELDDEALTYATHEAKKWFLDYSDLTDFEKNTMKNIIPFYSWLRKNLSNQISAMINYPENYAMIPKFEELFALEGDEYDASALPDYMKQLGLFPTRQLESGEYAMFNPNYPYQDWNRLPMMFTEGKLFPVLSVQELKEDIVAATHPFVRLAASQMTEKGYDFFYRRQLEETSPAPYFIRAVVSNPKLLEVADGFLRSIGKEGGLELEVDENGKLLMDARMEQVMSDTLPFLRHLEMTLLGVQQVGEEFGLGLDAAMEAFTNAPDDYDGARQAFSVMSFWLGVKYYPFDEESAQTYRDRSLYFEAENRRRQENRYSPQAVVRRQQYNNRLDRTIRRVTR